jgi:type II restriction enzyme
VSEAKHQGKDIENIRAGKLVGKKNDKDLMPAGNVIERAYKNVKEIANYMLGESYFPYILFLEGTNFLTQNVNVTRPDGRIVTLVYNDGTLNRIDRLTAANYGMPINTNLCENRFVKSNGANIMLQAASIYTKGDGEHWAENDMVEVMLDVARTSLKMLGKDLFNQLTKK